MTGFLFVTDLDRTLVGDDNALKTLNQQLTDHRQKYGTKIVYATGRSLFLYRQLISQQSLLPPDALITSVGSEIYFNPNEDIFDSEWAEIIAHGWNRSQVISIAGNFSYLTHQPRSEQGLFKISYHLSDSVASVVLPQLKLALHESGLDVKLIYSGGKDLDILPQKADKGLAVEFLRQKWRIDEINTVVCGDSGNDISLFMVENLRGIIVGNAMSELREWHEANPSDIRYISTGKYAAGIIEGLQYFRFILFS
ncbi:MAG TPA: sucrose-phosphate phosphatase [Cyanobacteria bacterium UBA11159]|nr:sucrose-phosphate phosphatase [Cyanobacteria bacterium UBA11367]HBE60088.1 sucrose-phosphate phosphatase [Cyanobacteria bacterium UBA11366]HBK64728.1 sucrose-phosphate phosphatase [Cyanobacteria bacterium UBA11166]HBR73227.1 sucrose-phosphate phosphatase [Cyanobacteria bacterium UBA11159]HCA97703.1 sucrose-phosphate phosphatase [Cyanobacteria bacterium UBA9226]